MGRPRPPCLRPVPLAVPAPGRPRLSDSLSVAGGAGLGPRWRARDLARRGVPRPGACDVRQRGLPPVPHALLVRRGRRDAAGAVLGWGGPGGAPHRGGRASAGALLPVALLSLGERRRTSVPVVSVGRTAARDRALGAALRADHAPAWLAPRTGALGRGALARVVALVSAHVPLRGHEARERGRSVARPHRARLPLLDPAVASLDRLVRAAGAPVAASRDDARDPGDRAPRALAHLRAGAVASRALRRVRPAGPEPARHRPHRQLRVLQPARAGTVRLAPRRPRARARAA